jgi:hypothetical protein
MTTNSESLSLWSRFVNNYLFEPVSNFTTGKILQLKEWYNDTIEPALEKLWQKVYQVALAVFACVCLYYPILTLPVIFAFLTYRLITKIDLLNHSLKDIYAALALLEQNEVSDDQKMQMQKIEEKLAKVPLAHAKDPEKAWEAQLKFLNEDQVSYENFRDPFFQAERCSITGKYCTGLILQKDHHLYDPYVLAFLNREKILGNISSYKPEDSIVKKNHAVILALRKTGKYDI